MPNEKNIKRVQDLTDKLADSAGAVFVDYQGLGHRQLEELRASVEEVGGRFVITKNTLLKIALKRSVQDQGFGKQNLEDFTGPTATLYLSDDIVSPVKKLVEFIKVNELPIVKSGLLQDRLISETEVIELSKLPSHEGLISMLMGQIQAPLYGLVNVITANTRNLVYALSAIKESRKGGEDG